MTDLKNAIALVQELHEKHGVKQKGGKKYTQVVHRVQALRETYGTDISIQTEILHIDKERVVVRALVVYGDKIIGTGHAEEWRSDGYVNKTSALENCETSAIGRALASIGLGGDEYASVEEINIAKNKQNSNQDNDVVLDNMLSEDEQFWANTFKNKKPEDYYSEVGRSLEMCENLDEMKKVFKTGHRWLNWLVGKNIYGQTLDKARLEAFVMTKDALKEKLS